MRSRLFGAAWLASGILAIAGAIPCAAAPSRALTVSIPAPPPSLPQPPAASPVLPGAAVPWSGSPLLLPQELSVVDGRTRFLTPGPAQDRCPHERVVFVPGVVNPFRPTAVGDGAFMCRRDAVAAGLVAP